MSVLEVSSRIQARALALDPVKVLFFLLLSPLYALGFAVRLVWFVLAFALAAGAEGWKAADAEIVKRQKSP